MQIRHGIQRPSTTWPKPTFSILVSHHSSKWATQQIIIHSMWLLEDCLPLFASVPLNCFFHWKCFIPHPSNSPHLLNSDFESLLYLLILQFSYLWNATLTLGLIWGFNELMHVHCLIQCPIICGQAVPSVSGGWVSKQWIGQRHTAYLTAKPE